MWRQNSSSSISSSASTATTSSTATSASTAVRSSTLDDEKLPPGWSKKESKSQKGRFYYISPSGKTQWVRPQVKQALRQYNWHVEVEVEFGEGRLGVGLREVSQVETVPYAQFQAVVDDLPRVNGKAGPAEIYNWSVKPDKRLTIGMRVTAIDGQCLAGYTYKEVADKLKRSSRPLKIKFADVEKGTVEDNPDYVPPSQETTKRDQQPSAYLVQKQEYTRVLVTSELHSEMWSIENHKLTRSIAMLKKKWEMLSHQYDVLNETRVVLRKENDQLLSDKDKFETMIKHLKLQEMNAMENPELVKLRSLTTRNQALTDNIAKMTSGNKKLRKDRSTLQATLDELQSKLAKVDQDDEQEQSKKQSEEDEFFGIDPTASPTDQLAAVRQKLRVMEEELHKEEKKTTRVQRELEQLNKQMASLTNGSSSSSASTTSSSSSSSRSRGQDPFSSSSKNEIAELEARILELRKKQRSVVESMAKAAQAGDQELAKDCQKKRLVIKEELKHAQDALNRLKDGAIDNTKASSSTKKLISASALAAQHQKSKPLGDKMPTLSGYLDKGPTEWSERGLISNMKTMRGARERWCEITTDGFLKYYKRRGDPIVRGEIDLSDKTFEVVCQDLERGTEFVLSTSTQQSHFFTKSNDELQQWVRTLRAANSFLQRSHPTKRKETMSSKSHRTQVTTTTTTATKDAATAEQQQQDEEADESFYGRATLGF